MAGAKRTRSELDRLGAGRHTGGPLYVSVLDFGTTLRLSSPNDPTPRPMWHGTARQALAILRRLPSGAGADAVRAALGLVRHARA